MDTQTEGQTAPAAETLAPGPAAGGDAATTTAAPAGSPTANTGAEGGPAAAELQPPAGPQAGAAADAPPAPPAPKLARQRAAKAPLAVAVEEALASVEAGAYVVLTTSRLINAATGKPARRGLVAVVNRADLDRLAAKGRVREATDAELERARMTQAAPIRLALD